MAKGGLKVLEDILAGVLPAPPIAPVLHFVMSEVEEARVVFKGWPGTDHLNPLGTVHGGWTATIMDSALACAVMTTLQPGEGYTTAEFKINLTRPIMPGMGEVTCEGKLVHRGRTLAHVRKRFCAAMRTASCWPMARKPARSFRSQPHALRMVSFRSFFALERAG